MRQRYIDEFAFACWGGIALVRPCVPACSYSAFSATVALGGVAKSGEQKSNRPELGLRGAEGSGRLPGGADYCGVKVRVRV